MIETNCMIKFFHFDFIILELYVYDTYSLTVVLVLNPEMKGKYILNYVVMSIYK